ncbi:MAG: AbrB/MazE/SpoVT family DNA-binding domain-containing protein, partial [Candidatus Competibacter sp.]
MPLRVIKKWGSSPAVRIPAAVMEAASLNLEQEVQVRAENGCVIIEPLAPVVALGG